MTIEIREVKVDEPVKVWRLNEAGSVGYSFQVGNVRGYKEGSTQFVLNQTELAKRKLAVELAATIVKRVKRLHGQLIHTEESVTVPEFDTDLLTNEDTGENA